MKTLKSAVIAVLVAFMMVNLSYADGFREKPKFRVVVNMPIEKAIKDPWLVRAMYLQIDQREIFNSQQPVYIAEVHYLGKDYRISGSLLQWENFFLMDGQPATKLKNAEAGGIE